MIALLTLASTHMFIRRLGEALPRKIPYGDIFYTQFVTLISFVCWCYTPTWD